MTNIVPDSVRLVAYQLGCLSRSHDSCGSGYRKCPCHHHWRDVDSTIDDSISALSGSRSQSPKYDKQIGPERDKRSVARACLQSRKSFGLVGRARSSTDEWDGSFESNAAGKRENKSSTALSGQPACRIDQRGEGHIWRGTDSHESGGHFDGLPPLSLWALPVCAL
ncbi:hypothetical protein LZ30DRAFT_10720 [Colletotrichum cereale]|nr:hypothetical protein LZ30DRAFT_10720 [Colletotrichum cereale]